MVRTQVQLTEKQAEVLKRVADREGLSMAEVIRRLVDAMAQSEALPPDREALKRRAMAAFGYGCSGLADMSARHDDYLADDVANERVH